jgi:GNAT superfamily N-acetyltransferase
MGAERGRPGGAADAALRVGDAHDVELVRTLFREYADGLGVDLSFQGFEKEIAALPVGYDSILVARIGGEPVGCVGIRPLQGRICEMKRLYVRPSARRSGAGRALVAAAIDRARGLRYRRMRLDTLPTMAAARKLYASLGFVEIEPYRHNPIEGSAFMELDLTRSDRGLDSPGGSS